MLCLGLAADQRVEQQVVNSSTHKAQPRRLVVAGFYLCAGIDLSAAAPVLLRFSTPLIALTSVAGEQADSHAICTLQKHVSLRYWLYGLSGQESITAADGGTKVSLEGCRSSSLFAFAHRPVWLASSGELFRLSVSCVVAKGGWGCRA